VYGSGENEWLVTIAEEGVSLSRQAGDRQSEAGNVGMMGFAALQLGDFDRANRALDESLKLWRELGDAWAAAHILTHLAVPPLRLGDYQRAAAYAEEALVFTQQTGDRLAANIALHILAQAAWASGEHERASRYFQDALELTFEVSDRTNASYCLQGLAAVAVPRGESGRAARLLGAAEVLLETAGIPLYAQVDLELHQRAADAAREQLGSGHGLKHGKRGARCPSRRPWRTRAKGTKPCLRREPGHPPQSERGHQIQIGGASLARDGELVSGEMTPDL
jgi:tetratricopeptide (TPR) repeat protein